MATAPQNTPAAEQLARRAAHVPTPTTLTFVIDENNEAANRATSVMKDRAGSAEFEPQTAITDLSARRHAATIRDDLNPELWLDDSRDLHTGPSR